ncbi:MAG TPA: hypothetical protein VMV10_21505 [Pirellulales bacterium]|nr:hypothetical protein [Pirellulales bacterium]
MSKVSREFVVEEDVLREHQELEALLMQVCEMFHEHRTKRALGAARLMDALDELREHLGMMFALKEHDGYLDHAAKTAAPLGRRIGAIKAEHKVLFEELSRLIDQCDLDVARGRWEQTWKLAEMTFENFCEQFYDQEAGEAELAQQVFKLDSATGD